MTTILLIATSAILTILKMTDLLDVSWWIVLLPVSLIVAWRFATFLLGTFLLAAFALMLIAGAAGAQQIRQPNT